MSMQHGTRVTADYRNNKSELQPWLNRTHVGTVVGDDDYMDLLLRGYVKVRWDFGMTYMERVESLTIVK